MVQRGQRPAACLRDGSRESPAVSELLTPVRHATGSSNHPAPVQRTRRSAHVIPLFSDDTECNIVHPHATRSNASMLYAARQGWWLPAPTRYSSRDDPTVTSALKFICPGGTSSRTVRNDANTATLLISTAVMAVCRKICAEIGVRSAHGRQGRARSKTVL